MITGAVSHEEAVVRHFMEDPELGEIMLQDAIADGDIDEIRRVQRRIKEAKSLLYWSATVAHAEETVRDGCKLEAAIEFASKALGVLKSAVPAGA